MIYGMGPFAAVGREAGKLRRIAPGAAMLAICAFFSACFLVADNLAAAMPGRTGDPGNFLPARSAPPQEAIQAISGSPYPGVIDCVLNTPLSADSGAKADIHINYPSFGNRVVDEDIRSWVADMAEAFTSHLDMADTGEDTQNTDAIIDAVLNGDPGSIGQPVAYELWGAYRVSRPSSAAISIAFELWNYTGNPEGNLDIITLNYSLLTGQRLELVDIFEKPEVALVLMSTWARKELEPRLGAAMRSRMLQEGTAPLVENFSSITLTPEGICINFQPWQVAPRDAGIQKVTMPLRELMPSSPLLALWGKSESGDEQTGID